MGVRELIADMKENSDKYFQERNPLYAEEFFRGYCGAKCAWSYDRLDRNFYSYFETWMPHWIEENVAPPHYSREELGFQGYREIIPKEKEEFAYFLELCELCVEDYDNGASIIHFPWSRKSSQEEYHSRIRVRLLHEIRLRPGMFVKDLRVDLLYYWLQGRCLVHREEGVPEEEIDATFCQEFGEWLIRWIRENVDENYTPQSKYWYEDIRRILPEGREELDYFLELCKLFFEDYGAEKGFDPYEIPESYGNHELVTISKVSVIPSWRPRKPMKSIILITADKAMSENICRQWKHEGKRVGCESSDFAMELRGESIYVWLEGDCLADYDDGKLQHVNISHPYFYNIRYSEREVMKYFMEKTRFPEDSYMDNGESILPIKEIRLDILGFIK